VPRARLEERPGVGKVRVDGRRRHASWHTFWNAGDEPSRILEIIAPAGFEPFFRELSALGGAINADPDELTALGARYGHYFKGESVPELVERFGLRIGEPLSGGWTP
jgi:hypothetical protein